MNGRKSTLGLTSLIIQMTYCTTLGCGIVEFSTSDEAKRAMSELNDTEFMGRQVFIREDREEGGR